MRRLIIAAVLFPLAAHAQQPTPELPTTVLVPTKYLLRLQALLSDPLEIKTIPLYQADFAPLLQAFGDCVKLQVPGAEKPSAPSGDCPEVVAALQGRGAVAQGEDKAKAAREQAEAVDRAVKAVAAKLVADNAAAQAQAIAAAVAAAKETQKAEDAAQKPAGTDLTTMPSKPAAPETKKP
jgi:hypothetical protein